MSIPDLVLERSLYIGSYITAVIYGESWYSQHVGGVV